MDWACLCDCLFSLPVEEKAIMESDIQALRAVQDNRHPFANADKIPRPYRGSERVFPLGQPPTYTVGAVGEQSPPTCGDQNILGVC